MKFLFADFKTRILALVLAVVTWVSVYREATEVFPAAAEVEFDRVQDILVMAVEAEDGSAVTRVDLRVSGPRGQRADLRSLRLRARLSADPGAPLPQTLTVEVTEDLLTLPSKFRLVEAKPQRLRVRIDRATTSPLRLIAPAAVAMPVGEGLSLVEGNPALGFRVRSATVSPNYASIRGPKSILDRTQTITVTPVNITGLPSGVHQIPTTIVARLDGHGVTTTTPILVTVEISEESQEAVFTVGVSLIQTEDYARDFTAEPAVKEVEVVVTGPGSVLTDLKSRSELLLAVIDIAGMRPEECRPVDDRELIATRPIVVQFRGRFPGQEFLEIGFRKPQVPESVVTFRKRAP
ncbi:MAG: YbbR-like domain-containing protein [Candidatus Brocadiae bacterium]|nr:YbbR-like domain-containing protein [Candidatus Brocadiia bacterium]